MNSEIIFPVTRFLDVYFSVECRIDFFTLGNNPAHILDHVTQDHELTGTEMCRILDASNLVHTSSQKRHAGLLTDDLVIAGQHYPAGTPIAFDGLTVGSRFAVIVCTDYSGDWRTFADTLVQSYT
jgi:hypothetical protein